MKGTKKKRGREQISFQINIANGERTRGRSHAPTLT
jgi:hypothetical protein